MRESYEIAYLLSTKKRKGDELTTEIQPRYKTTHKPTY